MSVLWASAISLRGRSSARVEPRGRPCGARWRCAGLFGLRGGSGRRARRVVSPSARGSRRVPRGPRSALDGRGRPCAAPRRGAPGPARGSRRRVGRMPDAPAGVGCSRIRRRSKPAPSSAWILRSRDGENATMWSIATTPFGWVGAARGGGCLEMVVGSPSSSTPARSRSDQPTMPRADASARNRRRTSPSSQHPSEIVKPSFVQRSPSSAKSSSSIVGAGILRIEDRSIA